MPGQSQPLSLNMLGLKTAQKALHASSRLTFTTLCADVYFVGPNSGNTTEDLDASTSIVPARLESMAGFRNMMESDLKVKVEATGGQLVRTGVRRAFSNLCRLTDGRTECRAQCAQQISRVCSRALIYSSGVHDSHDPFCHRISALPSVGLHVM